MNNIQLIDHTSAKKQECFPGLIVPPKKTPVDENKPEEKPEGKKRPASKKAVAVEMAGDIPAKQTVKRKRAVI